MDPLLLCLNLLRLMVVTWSRTRRWPDRRFVSDGRARDVSSLAPKDKAERNGSIVIFKAFFLLQTAELCRSKIYIKKYVSVGRSAPSLPFAGVPRSFYSQAPTENCHTCTPPPTAAEYPQVVCSIHRD